MFKQRIKRVDSYLREAQAKKKILKENLISAQDSLKKTEEGIVSAKKVRVLLQEVAQQTQKKLEYSVEKLVTLALESVFPDPYSFKVLFEQKRNKTECSLLFEKDGSQFKPLESSGGGPIDVASLALRMTFWKISDAAPILILDEPLKFVSADYRDSCGMILKELSSRLSVQMIIVSHLPELLPFADRVIEIRNG